MATPRPITVNFASACLATLCLTVLGGLTLAAQPPLLVPNVVHPFLAHPRAQRVATDGQRVFILHDGRLRSLDPALTRTAWSIPLKSYGGLTVGEGLVVVDNGFNALTAFDAATGRERWKTAAPRSLTWGGAAPVQTPLTRLQVTQGTVLAASSNDVQAWEARTGKRLWKVGASDPSWLGASANTAVFTARSGIDGYLKAVNLRDGKERWTTGKAFVGEVLSENEGGAYLYALQRYSSRPRLQLIDSRTGQNVVVEYTFPEWTNVSALLQRETLCAAGTVKGRYHVACLPRRAGKYVSGDRKLLEVLKHTPVGPAPWEHQVRQMIRTQSGSWLLGGRHAIKVQLPAAYSGCGNVLNFSQAGRFAVVKVQCGQGKGRIAVIDQQTAKVAAMVLAHGEVTDALLAGNRMIIVTDRDVLSVPQPR